MGGGEDVDIYDFAVSFLVIALVSNVFACLYVSSTSNEKSWHLVTNLSLCPFSVLFYDLPRLLQPVRVTIV